MPVHVKDIATNTKPLDQKIFEFLRANPDEFYTQAELQKELGEFRGFTALGSKVSPEWMLAGLVADIAFAEQVGSHRRDNEKSYAAALTSLVGEDRVQCVTYEGQLRFGVSKSLPRWVEQPKLGS